MRNGVKLPVAGVNPVSSLRTKRRLDVWKGTLNAGPTLAGKIPFLTTQTFNENYLAVSADGACLAYLAADLSVSYGPNSDLWIRDLSTGQTQQITLTRDLASVAWKP